MSQGEQAEEQAKGRTGLGTVEVRKGTNELLLRALFNYHETR